MDAISLTVFASRLASISEEMGAVLKRAAFSPNIRDRLDFSCAIFDAQGELCAQAAHIPVHLGSMAYAMRDIIDSVEWQDGDTVILNDPFLGGTHLPDVTLISPVFCGNRVIAFVANRAHHADIGASAPGSMPISTRLDEEGVVIPPSYLVRRGAIDHDFFTRLTERMRNPARSRGDFYAQLSANQKGVTRLINWIGELGESEFIAGIFALNEYAERLARHSLSDIPAGSYTFKDVLDDDGQGHRDIVIQATIQIDKTGSVHVDFDGTSDQVTGNLNCPLSVAAAGVFYVFRCLMPAQTPACAGAFRPISLRAPEGSLLNARRPAAVAAGNVETSTRVVDVVMGALAQAIPNAIGAASHGSMNNIAMGSADKNHPWDYYETIGGGMGASHRAAGLSAVQTHMTNTLNTPVEVLEMNFPLRVVRYEIRRGSGGAGAFQGGDGIVREFEYLKPASVTLLTERRRHAPWGLAGGENGAAGINALDGIPLPGKVQLDVTANQRLTIQTPGGGGFGIAK